MKWKYAVAVAVLVVGCGDCESSDDSPGVAHGGPAGSAAGHAGDSASGGSGGNASEVDAGMRRDSDRGDLSGIIDAGWTIPEELLLCGERACACADGNDNDGDGVADGFDLECQGPNDDDEGTFATGISGDNMDPKWQDCFFDGNSGAGNDGCRYHTDCLTGEKASDNADCTVTQACADFCVQRTPNGCDCFGCCTVRRADGSETDIVLDETCDEADLDSCTHCSPSVQCSNPCGECELCPGKTVDDLPDSCFGTPSEGGAGGESGSDPPSPIQCGENVVVCASTADCSGAFYCSYGCCTVVIQ